MAMSYQKYRQTSLNNILLCYVLLVAPVSIALFLYGFFPITHHDNAIATHEDIPRYVENVRVQIDTLYKPMVKKLIIMVIDALRWDFLAAPTGKLVMPVTTSLIANSSGCLLRVKLQSPTVTMPRIKAMMTGTVPNFIDVVLNFGSSSLSSDNLLLQAKKYGYKLIFYGDNTWLSLFPDIFQRYDGTTSFFVTDFTEVDKNVTRHIQDELNNDDWSIMILHYLGLDHIGHVEGPFGSSIRPKLREMDEIIARIARKVQYWNDYSTPALLVISGDHGMKDSGGHGGSTAQETTVPFVAIGQTRCSSLQYESGAIEVEQLDIAATLSIILGLPIPSTNLGSEFLNNIYDLTDSKRLFVLYYNCKQILGHFQKLDSHKLQDIHQKYLDTVRLHIAWLNAHERSSSMVEHIVSSYNEILRIMKIALISSMIKYDIHSMMMAILYLFHILCILFIIRNHVEIMHKKVVLLFVLNATLCLSTNYFVDPESMSLFHQKNIFHLLSVLLVISILYINCCFLANMKYSDLSLMKMIKRLRMFHIGALLHVSSFAGSSFIEEEHQTWYFFWATMISCLLYHCFGRLRKYHRDDPRYPFHIEFCIKLLLLLIGHRILRKLNSTGDKYAHLPDIAGWLKDDHSKVGMTLLLLAGLLFLIQIAYKCEDRKYKLQSLFLNTAIAICIYLRHMANSMVIKIPSRFSSSGIYEVQVFWGIIVLYLANCGYRIRLIIRHNKERFVSTMLFFMLNIWIMISAMLHQPYNAILLPMQIITSSLINTLLKENNFLDFNIFAHYWLGNVFYFYQGNSNSLANIDIAVGYVGLRSYTPFITGVYLIINTYSAPILAYLLLIYYQQLSETHRNITVRTSRIYIAWRLLTMTVYMIIVTVQRHHLFVWSVFSPKLLYEAVYSTIMCCGILLVLIVIILQSTIIFTNVSNDIAT